MAGQTKPGIARHQTTAGKDRDRVDTDIKGSSGIQAAAPGALCHISIPCLCCHWILLNHPSKAQMAHGKIPHHGKVLATVPAPTKDFKW